MQLETRIERCYIFSSFFSILQDKIKITFEIQRIYPKNTINPLLKCSFIFNKIIRKINYSSFHLTLCQWRGGYIRLSENEGWRRAKSIFGTNCRKFVPPLSRCFIVIKLSPTFAHLIKTSSHVPP